MSGGSGSHDTSERSLPSSAPMVGTHRLKLVGRRAPHPTNVAVAGFQSRLASSSRGLSLVFMGF
jgi:hypothetical protein